jgi:predicted anti-sigma-YlaC factor YlaD
MECSEIEKRITALLDGEITEPEKVLIEEHLKSCVDCQKEVEKLSQVSDCLNSLTEVEVSPYFIPRLKRRIKEEEVREFVRLPFFDWAKRIAVPVGVSVLFVIAIFGGNYLGRRLNQRVENVAELNEEVANVTGITSFEDFSEGSLVDAYAGLLTEGGK